MGKQAKTNQLTQAAQMLAAIGHNVRLEIMRLLMRVGPRGMPAGEIARWLEMPPSSLHFHLRVLQSNDLISSTTQGRFVIYVAEFEAMARLLSFLTEDCCGGNPCLASTTSDHIGRCVAPAESL